MNANPPHPMHQGLYEGRLALVHTGLGVEFVVPIQKHPYVARALPTEPPIATFEEQEPDFSEPVARSARPTLTIVGDTRDA